MKLTFDDIQQRESQHVLQTYRRQPVAFVRGKGPRLYDVDGREYLDFVSGIGVASLGHAHPGLAAVITDQAIIIPGQNRKCTIDAWNSTPIETIIKRDGCSET